MKGWLPAPRAAIELPHGRGCGITELQLCLKGDGFQHFWGGSAHESHRWCTALAQLHTLQRLCVSALEPARLSPSEFGVALQSLPALRKLSIDCEYCSDDGCEFARSQPLTRLIFAVAAVEQLEELSMTNCFYFGTMHYDDHLIVTDRAPLPQVHQLSRLTRLTSLAVRAPMMGPESSDVLVHAVKQMTALKRLHVGVDTHKSDVHAPAVQMLLQLCSATELVALTRLELPSSSCGGETFYRGALLDRMLRDRPPVLTRLTALCLDCALDGSYEKYHSLKQHVRAVLGLLANLAALRSLSLRHNDLRDDALVHIAPSTSALTALDVHGNRATHIGVAAVLLVAASAAAVGAEGLRELDIGSNLIAPDRAAEVAALLRQLTTLEALNLRGMFDGPGGLQELVPALEALPRLGRLRLPETSGICHPGGTATVDVEPLLTGLKHMQMD